MSTVAYEGNLLEEFESQEEDEELLEEMEKRKQRQKNFVSIINKKKLGKHELDEVML